MKADPVLRDKLDGRISGMESERNSWLIHWRELADYILPRRYRWLLSANQSRGGQINNNIIDSTGTIAARTCASGMLAGVTSPTRPWFKLQLDGFTNADDNGPISVWLATCEARMRRVFSESNFYNSIGVLYHDLVVFGTGTLVLYEDYYDVIRCYNPCAGEYFLANGARGTVSAGGCFAREFAFSVSQIVDRFGLENCPVEVKRLYEQKGKAHSVEFVIRHLVEPNNSPEYSYNDKDEIQLEKKSDMKKRGVPSPDRADALALTFAYPIYETRAKQSRKAAICDMDYDPFAKEVA